MSDLALSCKCKICGTRLALFNWTDASFGQTCSVWNRTGLVICSAESCMELVFEGWPAIVCGEVSLRYSYTVILKISAQNLLLWDSLFWKLLDLCSALSVVTSLAALVAILYLLLQCLHSDFPLHLCRQCRITQPMKLRCQLCSASWCHGSQMVRESHALHTPKCMWRILWPLNLRLCHRQIGGDAGTAGCCTSLCVSCLDIEIQGLKTWTTTPTPCACLVFFICCLRFDQVLKNLLAVPWHGSLEQCISLFVKHCFHCCQNLEQKLNFFAIEFCIQVFADNYASQDFAFRSSTYPAGRV